MKTVRREPVVQADSVAQRLCGKIFQRLIAKSSCQSNGIEAFSLQYAIPCPFMPMLQVALHLQFNNQ